MARIGRAHRLTGLLTLGCLATFGTASAQIDPLEIIEIQTGDYLGEDDIVRVEDDYGRIASDVSPGKPGAG